MFMGSFICALAESAMTCVDSIADVVRQYSLDLGSFDFTIQDYQSAWKMRVTRAGITNTLDTHDSSDIDITIRACSDPTTGKWNSTGQGTITDHGYTNIPTPPIP